MLVHPLPLTVPNSPRPDQNNNDNPNNAWWNPATTTAGVLPVDNERQNREQWTSNGGASMSRHSKRGQHHMRKQCTGRHLLDRRYSFFSLHFIVTKWSFFYVNQWHGGPCGCYHHHHHLLRRSLYSIKGRWYTRPSCIEDGVRTCEAFTTSSRRW